jgi:APA family basic amino acid/polyamine antiporter
MGILCYNSAEIAMDVEKQNGGLQRQVGLYSAMALVVANMVGTGIFTTSGFIIAELQEPTLLLLCWLAGGLFALCGALCYGELGARFPRAGGEYVFLRESFGAGIGFLSGWVSLVVGFSAPIAAAAIAFAAYFRDAVGLPGGLSVSLSVGGVSIAAVTAETLIAVGIVLALSALHCRSLKIGSRVQNALTLFKVLLILAFIAAALASGQGSANHFEGAIRPGILFGEPFAVALIFVTFAYSGWNAAAYLGAEIRGPKRAIPVALVTGTLLVTGLYLLLNLVYIYALPAAQMKGVMEVGARAAEALFGSGIARSFSGAIAFGLLSVVSAMILAGPRVYYAMAKDGLFFKTFARVDPQAATPARAIVLQAGIAVFMILTASYERLLLYIGFTLSLFAMLTVLGLMRLRRQDGPPSTGYKTLGYPVTPLLFVLGNLWIIYFSIRSRPAPAAAGIVTIVTGLIVYRYFQKKNRKGVADRSGPV